jgi:hypothetical protein
MSGSMCSTHFNSNGQNIGGVDVLGGVLGMGVSWVASQGCAAGRSVRPAAADPESPATTSPGAEGHIEMEILRCVKRYVVRQFNPLIWQTLRPTQSLPLPDIRQ